MSTQSHGPSLEIEKAATWFLTVQTVDHKVARSIPVSPLPFKIGRGRDASLCLPYSTVSGSHAEIFVEAERLILRDLDSTNGTYVNGQPVKEAVELHENDLIQFAEVVFRLCNHDTGILTETHREDVYDQALALVQFERLMSDREIAPFYQPIVDMHTLQPIGYEVLGRSRLFGLETPYAMFRAAAQLNLEAKLSRMLRWEGIQNSAVFPTVPHLFLNTHPTELVEPGLLDSMKALRDAYPEHSITLEIHEAAVMNERVMSDLRADLKELNISLAYDDFGAGQARLKELVEVQPDYLKFDIALTSGIHQASAQRQQMLATLVCMAQELGIVPLAEGIENDEDGSACREIGFELGQGFRYGRPEPAKFFRALPAGAP